MCGAVIRPCARSCIRAMESNDNENALIKILALPNFSNPQLPCMHDVVSFTDPSNMLINA